MNASPSSRRWRLSPAQIALGAVWSLFIIVIEISIAGTYLASQADVNTFSQAGDSVTNLANIQRQVLQLQVKTNIALNNPGAGFEDVKQQRAILASQVRVLLAQASGDKDILTAGDAISKSLSEFDAMLADLQRDALPEAYAAALPRFNDLFEQLERDQIKPVYDRAEIYFFNNISTRMQVQQRAQIFLLGMGLLFLVSSIVLIASTIRTSRASFENARTQVVSLEAAVAERTRALTASIDISRRLSVILDQNQLITQVVEQVKQAFDYYHVHIYLVDEKTQDLVMAGGTGETGKALLAHGHRIARGRGLVGRAAETRKTIFAPDISKEAGWLPNPLLPETKSEIAAPIIIGEQVLGVLDVQQNVVDGLATEDAEFLQSIAYQVASAIKNARSYTQAQQKIAVESIVSSIGQKIQNTTSVERALEVAAREFGRITGAKDTRVTIHMHK